MPNPDSKITHTYCIVRAAFQMGPYLGTLYREPIHTNFGTYEIK